jgi:hypothetical protein
MHAVLEPFGLQKPG